MGFSAIGTAPSSCPATAFADISEALKSSPSAISDETISDAILSNSDFTDSTVGESKSADSGFLEAPSCACETSAIPASFAESTGSDFTSRGSPANSPPSGEGTSFGFGKNFSTDILEFSAEASALPSIPSGRFWDGENSSPPKISSSSESAGSSCSSIFDEYEARPSSSDSIRCFNP